MMKDLTFNKRIQTYKKLFADNVSIKFRAFENIESNLEACIIYSEGMIIHETIYKTIIRPIQTATLPKTHDSSTLINYISLKVLSSEEFIPTYSKDKIIKSVYSGDTILFLSHCEQAIIINTRGWETRAIAEPKSERTTRGGQEGFTEAAIINITFLKRRIQNSHLKVTQYSIGSMTETDVFVAYLDNVATKDLLEEVDKRLKNINIDAVLDANYIAECISDKAYSPFETIGSTQKPDVAAAKLLEGKVAIIVNGSPEVLYLPMLFYEHFVCSEDYYYNYLFALFNRFIRILAFFISSSVPAIYIALVTYHQQILPKEVFMTIAVSRDGVPFLTFVELVIMLITFEILREAGARLSLNIGQAVSIVGAIVLGEAAVSAKLISAPIVIVTALSGITSLMLPKLMNVLIYIRFFFLILASLFGLYGYSFAFMLLIAYMSSLESFGVNFMTYINHYSEESSKDLLFRIPYFLNKQNAKNIIAKENSKTLDNEVK